MVRIRFPYPERLTMLDEKSLRRETFDPHSLPVVLADGQTWFLPPRGLTIHPMFKNGRLAGSLRRSKHGADHDALIAEMEAALATLNAGNDIAVEDVVGPIFAVACSLLALNYDLADDQYPSLLRYDLATGEQAPMLWRIVAIARGVDDTSFAEAVANVGGL